MSGRPIPIATTRSLRPRGGAARTAPFSALPLLLVAPLVVSLLLGGARSLALFTSSAVSTANSLATGTIVIGLGPASTTIAVANMAPGDTTAGQFVVRNAGSLRLRYAMTSSSTSGDGKGLASVLVATIRDRGTSCAAFDGTVLYSGALAAAAFGSASPGEQPNDRALDPATEETLCLRIALALTTGDAYQAASTSTTFSFAAEQTANNP
ncbi:MAG: hypothetical protein RL338_142 [Chloroflexota bacterium]|jgi:predicted ribosomally synthesized peptide with SipW-like signal peptide